MAKDFPIITLRSDCNPWEQQVPRESDLMYSRFKVFLELGPESDRLRQTLEVLNSTNDKLTYNTLKDYSSAFRWSARAAAHDRFMVQADRARMVRRRRRAIESQCKVAERLRLKALEALNAIDIQDLTPADIVRFVDLSYKIENSVYSEFVETAETPADTKAEVHDIASWSPAERRRRLDVLQRELAQRATRAADDDEVVA